MEGQRKPPRSHLTWIHTLFSWEYQCEGGLKRPELIGLHCPSAVPDDFVRHLAVKDTVMMHALRYPMG